MEINENLIKERIDLYMDKHAEEIIFDIDKRVEKAVAAKIKDIFADNYRTKSEISVYIEDKVQSEIKLAIDSNTIDTEKIAELMQKKIEREAKKIQIDLTMGK